MSLIPFSVECLAMMICDGGHDYDVERSEQKGYNMVVDRCETAIPVSVSCVKWKE